MLEAIKNRRSIRFFKDDYVSDETIREVLEAGFCAPSAHARAAWHAVVIRDQEAKNTLSTIHPWAKRIAKVPVVLAVCVERSGFDHFWIEDGSAFLENVMIQASSMGLGTCWYGVQGLEQKDMDAENIVRRVCNLPENFGVVALCSLGYPARHPGAHEPSIPEGRVHFESFENPMADEA